MDLVFTIEAKHVKDAQEWIRTHHCKLRKTKVHTAIGGKISYSFCDTSIGQIQSVHCSCGKELCLNAHDL